MKEGQYKTLRALVKAIQEGKITGRLTIDNDDTFFYPDHNPEEVCVFRMHPATLLEQALKLLGVKFEDA